MLGSNVALFAQEEDRVIELELAIETETSQDKLAEYYLELSKLYEGNDLGKALEFAQKSIQISESIHYVTQKIKGLHQLGNLYRKEKEFDKAIEVLSEALELSKTHLNQKSIALSYIYLADVYRDLREREQSKEYYFKALKIAEKIKNEWIKAKVNTGLGELSRSYGQNNIALQYYLEALNNILQTDNVYLQGVAYKNIAEMYRENRNIEKSIENFKQALSKFERIDNKRELAEVNFSLGELYQRKKEFDKAIVYMKNSLGFAELTGHQDYIKKGYKNLAEVYEQNNDFKNAYDYLKYYSAIKDTKFISELEAQIELEKKNREIALINQENQFRVEKERSRTYILLSIAILTIIFSIILYYNLRQKNKINKELEKATELAQRSKKEKEEFFAYTSHEIRTPLNAVVGMTQLLEQTNLDEVQYKYLKTIKYSAKNILFLVNDVLDLAKLEKGAIVLEKIDFSLRSIVNEIIDALSFKTKEKPVTLRAIIDEDVPDRIKGDPLRLNQILLNLTDNALKFTEKGEVTISIRKESENDESVTLYFEVLDTGIGIPPEKIEKIFKSYEQAGVDTTRNYGGTGLGLAITKQLVELMDSKIEIRSKEGEGTVFSFSITFPKGEEVDASEVDKDKVVSLSNVSILAVDDTDLNRSIFYDLVHSEKHNVSVDLAEDGEKALALCQKKKYDVILMDLQMPVLNGFDTTRKIREGNNLNRNTPVIAMTAHAIDGVAERCDEAGMDDYIAKPINLYQLYGKIKRVLPELTLQEDIPEKEEKEEKSSFLVTSTVNLTGLVELMGGKTEKIVKYIDLFLKNVPPDFEQLKEEFSREDWEQVARTAHKIKGNVGYMGIEKAKNMLITIEKVKLDVAILDRNTDIVNQLEEVLNNAYSDLEKIKNQIIS